MNLFFSQCILEDGGQGLCDEDLVAELFTNPLADEFNDNAATMITREISDSGIGMPENSELTASGEYG